MTEKFRIDKTNSKDLLKAMSGKQNPLVNPFQDGVPKGQRFDFLNYKPDEDQRPVRVWLNDGQMEQLRKMEAQTGIDLWMVFSDAIYNYYKVRL